MLNLTVQESIFYTSGVTVKIQAILLVMSLWKQDNLMDAHGMELLLIFLRLRVYKYVKGNMWLQKTEKKNSSFVKEYYFFTENHDV